MLYCPRCGNAVSEEMAFCPKCGASLKGERPPAQATPSAPPRNEKAEKREKGEKREKTEKHEKREKQEFGTLSWLIGGLVLILLGLMFYFQQVGYLPSEIIWSLFFIIVGVIVIVGAIAAMMASKRHPKT